MGEKIKVVMVDDEPDLCLMVKENLEETGRFEVSTTSKPDEVEKVVGQANPDVILLDVVMPKRKGTDIVVALKKSSATRNIPIIMVSGKGEMVYNKKKDEFKWLPNNSLVKERGQLPEGKGAAALTEAYGVQDYISKPFKTELLVQVIDEVLAKAKKRQPSAEEGT
jgi:two-component system alkaline phosphatase synthesis response regulator PhoP